MTVWALAFASPALAQDVQVTSYLDRTTVGLNEQFVLSVEISGSNATASQDPKLPDMSGFAQFLGSGSSQQIQIVNRQTTVSTTLQYRFLATREGTFEIGSVEVMVGGRKFTTDPVTLEVTATAGAQPTPGGTPARPPPRPDDATGIAAEDLFLRATASKQRVYENEPVIVEYKIYTVVPVTSYSLVRQPGTAGFWVEDFELPASPQTSTEVLNGRRYTVATLKKAALFPTGSGTRTVDPMAIETEVRARTRSQDPFDDFFGRSSLFGRSVSKVIASQPLRIEVLPLPSEGRPDDFSGLVGSLSVSGAADKTRVETNEAVTYRLEIAGTGNLRTLPEPAIDFPGDFEVYPPDTSERISREGNRVSGRRTFEWVIIPRAPGIKTVPRVAFTYFDPRTNSYATASADAVEIEVTGDPVLAPITAARGRGAIRTLRDDIRFIQTEPTSFRPVRRSVFQEPGFWAVFLLPLVALGGAVGYRRHQDRLTGDIAYARDRRATRVAKKRLAKARSYARSETHKEFYRETNSALLGFLGDRLNLPEAGMVQDDARQQLQDRGVSGDSIDRYFSCLAECDQKLFSPSSGDTVEMKALLGQTEDAMAALDRELARKR